MKIKHYIFCELAKRELLFDILLANDIVKKTKEPVAILWQDSLFAKNCIKNSNIYLKDFAKWNSRRFERLKKNGNKLFAFDQEGLIFRNKDFYVNNRVDENAIKSLDHILLWGRNQHKVLVEKFPQYSEKMVLFGSPLFQIYQKIGCHSGNLNNEIKNILITSRLSRADISIELQREQMEALGLINDEKDLEDLLHIIDVEQSLRTFFVELAKKLSVSYNVTFRPHPNESSDKYLKDFSNANVKVSDNPSVVSDIMSADLLISENCTTMIEAAALGVSVLGIELPNSRRKHVAFFNRQFPQAADFFEVQQFINSSDNKNSVVDLSDYISPYDFENSLSDIMCNQKSGTSYYPVIDTIDEQLKKFISNWGDAVPLKRFAQIKNGYDAKLRKFGKPKLNDKAFIEVQHVLAQLNTNINLKVVNDVCYIVS